MKHNLVMRNKDGEDNEHLAPDINEGVFLFRIPQKNIDEVECPNNDGHNHTNVQLFTTYNLL